MAVTTRPTRTLPRGAVRRRGNVSNADCPSRSVLDHVTSRWGSLVMIHLLARPHRFSELGRAVGGVSEKMLAQTLQLLEGDGFVTRTVYPTVPPKVEYALTALGADVAARVLQLADWVETNVDRVLNARAARAAAARGAD